MWTSHFTSCFSLYNDLIILCVYLSKMNNFMIFSPKQTPHFRFIIGNHLTWPTWLSLYNEEITMQTLLHKNIFSNPFSWVFLSSYLIFKPLKIETNHYHSYRNFHSPKKFRQDKRFALVHHINLCRNKHILPVHHFFPNTTEQRICCKKLYSQS